MLVMATIDQAGSHLETDGLWEISPARSTQKLPSQFYKALLDRWNGISLTSDAAKYTDAYFEIALICALRVESDAVEALFDELYQGSFTYGNGPGDRNAYTTGRIHDHDVVLAYLLVMGKTKSASAAASFRADFTSIKLYIVVETSRRTSQGTDDEKEIVLGDVIISKGQTQFDFGRQYATDVVRKSNPQDNLNRSNTAICAFLAKWILASAYPGPDNDRLYRPVYCHKHQDSHSCSICTKCQGDGDGDAVCSLALVSLRSELQCGDSELVMKFGQHCDEIASREQIIAFEMKGARMWESFLTVIVKGVCDYADSHKSKGWENYAAATAAACMKAFLLEWRPEDRLVS
ncbi:hypothetical protein BJX64DRAFT_273319 [Aspergillus heterothallicus]